MANTFDKTQEVVRDHEIGPYHFRIVIDGEGIRFYRKGDRHPVKPYVELSWDNALAASQHVAEAFDVYDDFDKYMGF